MNNKQVFYICPSCFYTRETLDNNHKHPMLCVDPGAPGDERRKPVMDRNGQILTPAPRWFQEALLQTRYPASKTTRLPH
jgi:hypothetical protein